MISLLSVSLLILKLLTIIGVANCDGYTVPEPKIKIFTKGFRVSIPHEKGINLFAFHGNINKPMDFLEAGQFSKDILKRNGNEWIFEDGSTELNVGDVIHYWLFVIKSHLGYRYDNGEFVVKEIVPYIPVATNYADNSAPSTMSSQDGTTHQPPKYLSNTDVKPVSRCCTLLVNLTQTIVYLSSDIEQLREENRILSQIAEKEEYFATNLKIFGKFPTTYYPTPKDFVQNLIKEKLELNVKVVDAKKIPDDGVSFTVETLKNKVEVILAAQEKLNGSNYELAY